MNRATVFLSFFVLLVALVASANATILYSEDFSSGNAARAVWEENPGPANFDASSGDYVLTQPDGDTPVFSFLTGVPEVTSLTDTSVRAQIRLEGSSEGTALFARNDGSTVYQGGFDASLSVLYLGWNDGNAPFPGFSLFDAVAFDYDLNAEDLVLQMDVVANELTLWAWRPGEAKPDVPQLTYTDDAARATSGSPGILIDPDSPGVSSAAIFRYFQVGDSPIPEPSTIALTALAFLAVLCTVCRSRHSQA